MPEIARGIIPAGKRLLPLILLLAISAPFAARADNAIVDVRALPRLEGAVEDASRTQSYRLSYGVPTPVPVASAAIKKLLAADGWVQFLRPLDENSGSLTFKKARQGLQVSFTQGPGRPDQSVVNYIAERISGNVPFPPDAADIVFDPHRPYLGCIAPLTLEATQDFFRTEMAAIGWKQLTAADITARWPSAEFNEAVENGVRAYYSHADGDGFYRQRPVMLTLQRRGDGRTDVEIRVAPFALPELEADSEMAGLPRPKPTKAAKSLGGSSSDRRQVDVAVIAELPATLAFYRRELASRNWTEQAAGAVVSPDNVALNFSSPEQTATLKLSRKYDLTLVSLTTQVKAEALAARARAKKEADENFMKDAAALAKQVIAADEARRVAQAAGLSDTPLRALADSAAPVPLPENAEGVKFDGTDGRLEFNSASSVKAISAFYRSSLGSQGWKEKPSVINQPNMAVMTFSKDRKTLSLTAMQMGPKVRVSADGSALVMANAASQGGKVQERSGGKTVTTLEPDTESALPVPKQRTMMSMGTGKIPGSDAPLRRELEAAVPAELDLVLAFYRSEFAKRGWQETADGAITKADQVRLAFNAPDGPATLKLGRRNGETTVNLAQKYPAAAAKADVAPKPGRSKLMFGNIGKSDATISINKQTIKVAAGAGGPQSPKPPMIDLPPGKYQYALKIAGGPARNNQIEIGAGDTWGVMIGPDGDVLPLQMY